MRLNAIDKSRSKIELLAHGFKAEARIRNLVSLAADLKLLAQLVDHLGSFVLQAFEILLQFLNRISLLLNLFLLGFAFNEQFKFLE